MFAEFAAPFATEQKETKEIITDSLESSFKLVAGSLHWQFAIRSLRRVPVQQIQVRTPMPTPHIVQDSRRFRVVVARMRVPTRVQLFVTVSIRVYVEHVLVREVDRLTNLHRDFK